MTATQILSNIQQVLAIEQQALQGLQTAIGQPNSEGNDGEHPLVAIVHALLACKGKVVVTGMGKSGHIARKIAATLASTGTPAFFVHPAEANHGDLGMITSQDIVIALSNSGETHELLGMLPLVKRLGAVLISFTGQSNSSMAKLSDIHFEVSVAQEACPHNLAPTASTTAALAIGDAIAVATLQARGFTSDDFARSHPAGSLGKKLLTRVSDVMRPLERTPHNDTTDTLAQGLLAMTRYGMGMTAVLHPNSLNVAGIFTDGDLRRLLEKQASNSSPVDFSSLDMRTVMSAKPQTITPDAMATEALQRMETSGVNQLLVINDAGDLLGALHMHGLLEAKIV
jgi:arabinose-5-phosphate isomerase